MKFNMNDFVPVKNFEDRYFVNEKGNVYSIAKDKILKPSQHKLGYYYYDLRKDKFRKVHYIHRLVAEYFIPNPLNKPCINHIDGNKTNNKISNLEWCTQKENNHHARRTGLCNMIGESHPNSVLTETQVIKIKSLLKDGLSEYRIAEMYNVSRGCIQGINKNINWTHI